MKRKKFLVETENKIVDMYKDDFFSIGLIAKKLNVNYKVIHRILIEKGVKIRTQSETKRMMVKKGILGTRKKLFSPDVEDKIVHMYLNTHFSPNLIAKEININNKIVYRILKEKGIQLRTQSATKKLMKNKGILKTCKRVLNHDIEKKIVNLYLNSCFSIGLISNELNIGDKIIKRVLSEKSIKLRTRSETKKLMIKKGLIKKIGRPFKKGHISLLKGKTWDEFYGEMKAEEIKKNLSYSKKGKKNPKNSETRKRLFKEGKLKSWNKGLTKETDDRMKSIAKMMKERTVSEKSKRKQSKTMKMLIDKGIIPRVNKGSFKKGQINLFLGKKHTEETKERLRQYKGEKASGWRGGISFEPYGIDFNKQFKESIKERDNYVCQSCQKHKSQVKSLHIHHIDYIKTNNFTFNCITLCISCHMLTNKNRTYWQTFFNDYLRDKYGYDIQAKQQKITEYTEEKIKCN